MPIIKHKHNTGKYPDLRRDALAAKIPYYFTGRVCAHGHTMPRESQRGHCISCKKSIAKIVKEQREKKPKPEGYISAAEAKVSGLPHYYTGEPCKKGHVSPRYTHSFRCVQCRVEDGEKHKKKMLLLGTVGRPSEKNAFTMPGYGSLHRADQDKVKILAANGADIWEICRTLKKSYFLVDNFLGQAQSRIL